MDKVNADKINKKSGGKNNGKSPEKADGDKNGLAGKSSTTPKEAPNEVAPKTNALNIVSDSKVTGSDKRKPAPAAAEVDVQTGITDENSLKNDDTLKFVESLPIDKDSIKSNQMTERKNYNYLIMLPMLEYLLLFFCAF
uniref:Uncharacterized protein n=1 Tax=Rhabditophanes sp. KR3021 TaxID=114890 RepID=A0AC35UIN0_9BILA